MFSSNSTSLPYNGVSHNDYDWWKCWDLPCNGWWWYWFILINVSDDDGADIYFIMKCMYVTKTEHFLKLCQDEVCHVLYSRVVCLPSGAPEAWRETLRKSTNAPTLTVIRPDDPLLVGYGLAWMMMTVITPLPHLATLRLRLKCNDYSPPPELEGKQSWVLKDSLWLHHFTSPKSSRPFEKIPFNFFAKL